MREHIVGIIGDKPDFTPNKIYEGFLELIDKLKFAKSQPKQKWNEEDEKNLAKLASILEIGGNFNLSNWLKSLRPQPKWKPSEEQLYWLKQVIPNKENTVSNEMEILSELYCQLKAL